MSNITRLGIPSDEQRYHLDIILIPAYLYTGVITMLSGKVNNKLLSKYTLLAKYSASKCRPEILNMFRYIIDNFNECEVEVDIFASGNYVCYNHRGDDRDKKIYKIRTYYEHTKQIIEDISINSVKLNCSEHELYTLVSALEYNRLMNMANKIIKKQQTMDSNLEFLLNSFK